MLRKFNLAFQYIRIWSIRGRFVAWKPEPRKHIRRDFVIAWPPFVDRASLLEASSRICKKTFAHLQARASSAISRIAFAMIPSKPLDSFGEISTDCDSAAAAAA